MQRKEPSQFIDPKRPQFQLVVRRFAPFREFSGFEGDNRSFSSSDAVTYKTGLFVTFDLASGKITEGPVGNSTGTRRPGGDAKTYGSVGVKLNQVQGDIGRITFSIKFAGSNPGTEGFFGRMVGLLSPNIDTQLEFVAFLKGGGLFVAGQLLGDGFPNAEVFVRDNRRQGHMLLQFQTPHGPTLGPLTRLPFDGTRRLGQFKEGIRLNDRLQFNGSTRWI